MYLRYADGRDDGMRSLPEDSAEVFEEWLVRKEMRTGHPWEISGSMSLAWSVHCFVCTGRDLLSLDELAAGVKEPKGYYFAISGSALHRTREVVRFFLAVYDMGVPVVMRDMDVVAGRLSETDRIGIEPCMVSTFGPNYGGEYADLINLPEDGKLAEQVIRLAQWKEPDKVELSGNGADM